MEKISRTSFMIPLGQMNSNPAMGTTSDTLLRDALKVMVDKKIGSLMVDDAGIITERDFVRKTTPREVWNTDIKVGDICTREAVILSEDHLVEDALKLIEFLHVRHVPFRKKNGTLRMLGARDLLFFMREKFPSLIRMGTLTHSGMIINDAHDEAFSDEMLDDDNQFLSASIFFQPVRKAIQKEVGVLDVQCYLSEVLKKMKDDHGAVLITEFDSRVVGIITERDFLIHVFSKAVETERTRVTEVMTGTPHLLLSRHKLGIAINNMTTFNYRSVAIVDQDHMPISLVSIVDILSLVARRLYGFLPDEEYQRIMRAQLSDVSEPEPEPEPEPKSEDA